MKYAKINNKSFKATETETIHREEIYTGERLSNMQYNINEHIDILNHKLTKAQEELIDCLMLIRKAKGFDIEIPLPKVDPKQ